MPDNHRAGSRSDRLFKKLKFDLTHGKFPAGQLFSERALAGEYHAGHAVMRRAVDRLCADGNAVKHPGRGVEFFPPEYEEQRIGLLVNYDFQPNLPLIGILSDLMWENHLEPVLLPVRQGRLPERFFCRQWDGILLLGRLHHRELFPEIIETGIPILQLQGVTSRKEFVFVRSDERRIGFEGAEHLYRANSRRIGFCRLVREQDDSHWEERFTGAKTMLAGDAEAVLLDLAVPDSAPEKHRLLAEKLQEFSPDALIVASHTVMPVVNEALKLAGMECPQDLNLVILGSSGHAHALRDKRYDAIACPLDDLARLAVKTLKDSLSGLNPVSGVFAAPETVVCGSVRKR